VVLGQDPGVADRREREHRVVRHDDISLASLLAGSLGEALVDEGAPRAEALEARDAHLTPRALAHPGLEVVPVTRLGLLGPAAHTQLLCPEVGRPARGGVEERGPVLGVAAFELVAAHVVLPPLEQRGAWGAP